MLQTLAKVVEGWKKRDTDKQEMIEKIKKEKEEAVEISNKQRSVSISSFQWRIAHVFWPKRENIII